MSTTPAIDGPIRSVNVVYNDLPSSVTLYVNGLVVLVVRYPDDLAPLFALRAQYERAMVTR